MNHLIHQRNGIGIAELTSTTYINSGQAFLDVAMNLPCERIIIHKHVLD